MQQKPPTRREQQEAKNRLKLADKKRLEAEAEQKELEAREKGDEIRRRAQKARRDARSGKEEERLAESARRRHLQDARRKEKEERKKQRAAYQEKHPGFYNPSLRLHSVLAALLAIIALFFVAAFLFKDYVGTVGSAIAYSLLGWFSYIAYALPLFMIVHAIYWRTDVRDRILVKKALSLLPMTVFAASFAAMWSADFSTEPISAALAYSNGNRLVGGGVVGEFVARTLCRYIGPIGLSLIGIAFFVFFVALYFRATLKSLYIASRARLKVAMVERAKKRAARAEEKKRAAEAQAAAPSINEAAPSDALPENRKKLLTESNAAVREERAKTRRRALFADLEEGLDVDRSPLPSGNRGKQLFDFETEKSNVPPAPTAFDPFQSMLSATVTPSAPKAGSFSENADFSGDRLTVTRERIRPVRVSTPAEEYSPKPTPAPIAEEAPPPKEAPTADKHHPPHRGGLFHRATADPVEDKTEEDHSGMEYFRKITVAATAEEERAGAPVTDSAYGHHSFTPSAAPAVQKSAPVDAYDSFAEDEDEKDLTADVPMPPAPTPPPTTVSAAIPPDTA